MKTLMLYTVFLMVASLSYGQTPYDKMEESLRDQFGRLVSGNTDIKKLELNDSIRMTIGQYAASKSVFDHKFNGIRYLGEITSPDSSIKLITWNLNLTDYKGRYYCYLIRKGEDKNTVFPLESSYSMIPADTDTTFTGSSWYGALYYDLRSVPYNNERYWVALGLDYGNPEVTRKIIDVINFDDKGLPVFGKKWFQSPIGMKHRIVFEYSASAMMTLRFSSDTSVVFDHLVPISPELAEKRQYYGPDYSYDAYIFSDGFWKFNLNVDVRNRD